MSYRELVKCENCGEKSLQYQGANNYGCLNGECKSNKGKKWFELSFPVKEDQDESKEEKPKTKKN